MGDIDSYHVGGGDGLHNGAGSDTYHCGARWRYLEWVMKTVVKMGDTRAGEHMEEIGDP